MIKKTTKSNILALDLNLRRKFFFGFLGFVVLSFVVYIYLIGVIVFNIVERKNAEAEMKSINNHLTQLEFEYLNKSRGISLEYAKTLGFKEPSKIGFVGRSALTKNTSRANEI